MRHVDIVAAARRVHFASHFRAAFLHQQALHVEEQILAPSVITRSQDRITVKLSQAVQAAARVRFRNNPLPREHQCMGRVNFDQRIEEIFLRVVKIDGKYRFRIDGRGESFGGVRG